MSDVQIEMIKCSVNGEKTTVHLYTKMFTFSRLSFHTPTPPSNQSLNPPMPRPHQSTSNGSNLPSEYLALWTESFSAHGGECLSHKHNALLPLSLLLLWWQGQIPSEGNEVKKRKVKSKDYIKKQGPKYLSHLVQKSILSVLLSMPNYVINHTVWCV